MKTMPDSTHLPKKRPIRKNPTEPGRSSAADPPSPRNDKRSLALRGIAALALAVSAYIHIDLAAGPLFADGKVTLAGLFIGQAIAAALVAVWVLLRGSRLSWFATGGLGLASLAALVVTVYVLVPSIGPLPAVYEPFWYPEKVVAAAAAALAAATALVALLRTPR